MMWLNVQIRTSVQPPAIHMLFYRGSNLSVKKTVRERDHKALRKSKREIDTSFVELKGSPSSI